jgi:hypothetical protein
MPLPPIPIADWLGHQADQWRKRQQTQLDQLRNQASAWDLEAQRAVHGIGDTFSGLGTAVQEALPDLPPPPPLDLPAPPALELPQPVADLGASLGGAFSDLGSGIQSGVQGAREAVQAVAPPAPDWSAQAQAAVDSISGATGGGLEALTDPATYGRAAGVAPLPPGLEGIRPGLRAATQNAAQAVDTLATDPASVAAAARAVNRLTPTGMIGSLAGQIQEGTTPRQLGREVVQGLPALGAVGTLAPTPGAIAGNVLGSVAEQGALGLGLPEGVAGGAGFLADVLTPDPGTAGRVAARAPGVLSGLASGADELAASAPRFGTLGDSLAPAGAALDEAVLGIRRGQRGVRVPRLSPEQLAQREADGAAEQRVFDAIQRLWRQGPEGEALADDLRFLAVGKGTEGEAAARTLLTRKGLGDLLPPGVIPEGAAPADGLLGAATRATDPFLARGALTGGERAFDLAAGTAGGVLGAATADEDATWQERAGRGVLGASLGALAGANARQLGRLGVGALGDDALGAVAGAGGPGGRFRRPTVEDMGNAADVLSSAPLASPPSLVANALSGVARTLERLAYEGGEVTRGGPLNAAVDAGAMVRKLGDPELWAGFKRAMASGPTPRNPGVLDTGLTDLRPGAPNAAAAAAAGVGEGLVNAPGRRAQVLTVGTRLNAATDEIVRGLNEAGAAAVADRRGLTGAQRAAFIQKAGDFATITGPNSPVAGALNTLKRQVRDPDATFGQRAVGWVASVMSPYVNMPERILNATLSGVTAPVRGAANLAKAGITRDPELAHQAVGQLVAGSLLDLALVKMATGEAPGVRVYGPPPQDQKQRKAMERDGAHWEAFVLGDPRNPTAVLPTRNFGVFGQQAGLIAAMMTEGAAADAKGEDFWKHAERYGDELLRWTLDQSYLSDYADFADAVKGGRGVQGAAGILAGVPGRVTSVVSGPANAADPYARETGSLEGQLARAVPGGRWALPPKIDPTTGEPLRREGTGLTRYVGLASGTVETPAARELGRLGVTPHAFTTGEYAGEKQTPQVLEKVRRYVGGETAKAVRETVATPEYQQADDETKTELLEEALKKADFEAALRLGTTVKRAPRQQADWEYEAVPHYDGAKKGATDDEIRRDNQRVRAAKAARTKARKKYPDNPSRGETEWAKTHREQFLLAQRGDADEFTLKKRRREIDEKYKVER